MFSVLLCIGTLYHISHSCPNSNPVPCFSMRRHSPAPPARMARHTSPPPFPHGRSMRRVPPAAQGRGRSPPPPFVYGGSSGGSRRQDEDLRSSGWAAGEREKERERQKRMKTEQDWRQASELKRTPSDRARPSATVSSSAEATHHQQHQQQGSDKRRRSSGGGEGARPAAAAGAPVSGRHEVDDVLRGLSLDRKEKSWFYADPSGAAQGPYSLARLQEWLSFLTASTDPQHVETLAQYTAAGVWRDGMGDAKVRMDVLLARVEGRG